jgi:hypothetical protein
MNYYHEGCPCTVTSDVVFTASLTGDSFMCQGCGLKVDAQTMTWLDIQRHRGGAQLCAGQCGGHPEWLSVCGDLYTGVGPGTGFCEPCCKRFSIGPHAKTRNLARAGHVVPLTTFASGPTGPADSGDVAFSQDFPGCGKRVGKTPDKEGWCFCNGKKHVINGIHCTRGIGS